MYYVSQVRWYSNYIYIQKKIDNYKIMFYNINNEVNNKKIYYILFYYIIKLFSKRKKNILPLAAFRKPNDAQPLAVVARKVAHYCY